MGLSCADMALRHETLVAWQRADDMFLTVHEISRRFPTSERFELGSQLRRAAYSVVANIVESVNRRTASSCTSNYGWSEHRSSLPALQPFLPQVPPVSDRRPGQDDVQVEQQLDGAFDFGHAAQVAGLEPFAEVRRFLEFLRRDVENV